MTEIERLINEFDLESKNFYDALANGNEPGWTESLKKLKVTYKLIQIEVESMNFCPSMDIISRLSEIQRMMNDYPSDVEMYNNVIDTNYVCSAYVAPKTYSNSTLSAGCFW